MRSISINHRILSLTFPIKFLLLCHTHISSLKPVAWFVSAGLAKPLIRIDLFLLQHPVIGFNFF